MRGLAIACALLATPAAASTLIFQIWPTTFAENAVFCSITLENGQFTAVEMKGMRMGTPLPLRWHARPQDEAAMIAVLGDFITGTLPAIETMSSVLPPPPFVSATYWVPYDGGLRSGTLMLPGHNMPPPLSDLIHQLIPDGLCAAALAR